MEQEIRDTQERYQQRLNRHQRRRERSCSRTDSTATENNDLPSTSTAAATSYALSINNPGNNTDLDTNVQDLANRLLEATAAAGKY